MYTNYMSNDNMPEGSIEHIYLLSRYVYFNSCFLTFSILREREKKIERGERERKREREGRRKETITITQ